MKRLLFLMTFSFFSTAGSVWGQDFHAGVMVGPSWPVGDAGSSVDTGYGAEGWIAVDLPGIPVTPRAAYTMEWFSSAGTAGDLDTRGGRLDLLVSLPALLPRSYGFVGGGIQEATSESFEDPSPVASFDAELVFAAGIGTRIGLGPVQGTIEGRYLTVPEAEFQALQLRLGLGF